MTTLLHEVLQEHAAQLLDDWLIAVKERRQRLGGRHGGAEPSTQSARRVFEEIRALLIRGASSEGAPGVATGVAPEPGESLLAALHELVAEEARQGLDAGDIVGLLITLKRLIAGHLVARTAGALGVSGADVIALDQVFDPLGLAAFADFLDIRERIITQQSLSLLELSTPVLRLWHSILLLPLIGVIDTVRARQITESLLESIARYEARVTILDLSGVPVLDTSVAQHLMKTIDAARLLGTRIVMTGISPEGAQTLTKLGVRFGDVISRATLRAGIAEALLMVGQRIAPLEDARS